MYYLGLSCGTSESFNLLEPRKGKIKLPKPAVPAAPREELQNFAVTAYNAKRRFSFDGNVVKWLGERFICLS